MSLWKLNIKQYSSTILSKSTTAQTNLTVISNMLGTFKLESTVIDSNFDFEGFIAEKEKSLEPLSDSLEKLDESLSFL